MRRAIGWLMIECGLALATVTMGSALGHFTILDSGDAAVAQATGEIQQN